MNTKEKDIIYSESVKAGKRIYYLDVKESRNGDRYVSITESKKIIDEEGAYYPSSDHPSSAENTPLPRFSFEKHKIFLYKEDFEKFQSALGRVIGYVRNGHEQPAEPAEQPHLLSDPNLNIDIDF